jgi:hypothetical protein
LIAALFSAGVAPPGALQTPVLELSNWVKPAEASIDRWLFYVRTWGYLKCQVSCAKAVVLTLERGENC